MTSELHRLIHAQPDVLGRLAALDVTAAVDRLRNARRIVLVGTGTSFHAADLAASLLRHGRVDAVALTSVQAARWEPGPDDGTAYVIISHTGSTAYARRLRHAVLQAGRPLVSVTGDAAEWDESITTGVRETSETYSASYTAALAVLGLLAHHLVGSATGPEQLRRTAEAVRETLDAADLDGLSVPRRAVAIVGAGPWSVTAAEGALKLREAAHVVADGFDPERLLHGAAVPYGPGDLMSGLQPDADPDGLVGQVLDAARSEGVTTHVLSDTHDHLDPYLRQLPATARLQLLADRVAAASGTDPDTAITGAWAAERLWSTGA